MTERPRAISHDVDEDSDGVPIPASQPMSKQVADWYVAHTKGQLQAFCAADGQWYLYVAKPIDGRG